MHPGADGYHVNKGRIILMVVAAGALGFWLGFGQGATRSSNAGRGRYANPEIKRATE